MGLTHRSKLSRRDFLKLAGAGAGALLVSRCAPGALDAPTPTAAASRLPDRLSTPTPVLTRTPRIVTPTPTTTPVPTPTSKYVGRKLCFVLWDHQLAKYSYLPRNRSSPVPETCPLYSGSVTEITPEWEAYWKGILHVCNPDVDAKHFESAWQSLVAPNRAFTNGTGPFDEHFAWHSLTCGGATHEMVTGIPDDRGFMEIYVLNGRKAPPRIPSTADEIDMTRHFFATTGSGTKLPDGSYAVRGFPQFDNCIIPLVSNADTDRIDVTRIKVVDDLQRPYNP